jgi:ribosomal protein S18 acetylase RimI-like enzyme
MSTFPLPRNVPCDVPHSESRPEGDSITEQRQPDFSVVVRTAQQQDLAALSEVLASSFHAHEGMFGFFYPLLRMGIYEDLRSRLRTKAPRYACLVALRSLGSGQANLHQLVHVTGIGDKPVGTVELAVRPAQVWQSRRGSYLYLSNLAVQPEYRRHGVAQQLLQTCEQMALDWGYENLYLHVLENNAAARRLYRREGYQLHEVETSLGAWFLGQPKQLFLRKVLRKGA